MAHVQQHAVAPWGFDRVALLLLAPECLAEPVARTQFHGLEHRLTDRRFRSHAVVLQIAPAVLVQQNAAFAAATFGEQDAVVRQTGGMVLDEFHILERRSGAIGQRHAITGLDVAVGGERKHLAATTRRDDDRARLKLLHLPIANFQGGESLTAPVLDQQVGGVVLVEALDAGILQRSLKQGVQDVEPRLVGGEPGTLDLHAAERAHGDGTIRLAAPRTAPMFQLGQFLGCLVDEILDGVLIAQPVAAAHRVVEVQVEAIIGLDDTRGSAFGGTGVTAHGIDFRN